MNNNPHTAPRTGRDNTAAHSIHTSSKATMGKKRNYGGHNNSNNHAERRPSYSSVVTNKRAKLDDRSFFNGPPGAPLLSKHAKPVSSATKKHHNKKTEVANVPTMMDLDPVFSKLDQSDPAQARRIQQRRKMVQMGKNTPGYFEYSKQVPKHKRRAKSMDTPSTPDHTLNIPNKRWQGMLKSWRKALHRYDPPEMVDANSSPATSSEQNKASSSTIATNENVNKNTQARQIEEAIKKGLLVDVSSPATPKVAKKEGMEDMCSPVSVFSENTPSKRSINMEDVFAADDTNVDEEDSDDDLL